MHVLLKFAIKLLNTFIRRLDLDLFFVESTHKKLLLVYTSFNYLNKYFNVTTVEEQSQEYKPIMLGIW